MSDIFTSSYWPNRIRRAAVLAATSAAMICVFYSLSPPPDVRHRLSVATAYAALLLLAATLLMGPWRVLRRRPNPVSFDLRRDTAIAAGVLALVHTAIGITVHLRGRPWMYFFRKLHPLRLQTNTFGGANWTGLAATLLIVMLLAISNDASVRRLGTVRWKVWQRWTYAAGAFTLIHGVLFQSVEKRQASWIALLLGTGAAVTALQLLAAHKQQKDLARAQLALQARYPC